MSIDRQFNFRWNLFFLGLNLGKNFGSLYTMKNLTVNHSKNTVVVPPELICPITMEIMIHPVMTRYGHCFDRLAIMTWICSSDDAQCECPLTRKPLRMSDIINNHSLRERIQAWCDENCYDHKQSESRFTTGADNDSSCDGDYDDFASHFFASADFNTMSDRKNWKDKKHRNSLARSQNLRNSTGPIRSLIRMAFYARNNNWQ